MVKRFLVAMGVIFLTLSVGSSVLQKTDPPSDPPLPPQEYPAEKAKDDYMSSFFSRNTKPLGLKEDLAVRQLLRQPATKWAVRAGRSNILN
jgi:hypothetical protein